MAGFRYKHGDRPLDGYTIQHAAGRGGFGEVYYALSDSGREVALKVINGYEQIELRGVSQCMNLKSPHLVTIFDVRHNLEGVPFVIMEFVSGPSLRQIIDESPAGIGTQKAAFFLREMGKGLAFLHDCGIVHRDLKPGNIFYENGCVKIGDYGLSKAISTTQHSQTVTVGTVQYMAPEIGQGRYDKTIDIYALGAVLFEMLTGQVPYLGASPGEILMKHMTGQPDLRNIEEPFATVIRKAMARNPDDRYQNVQEMIEAVFGAEHVRQSVSCFSPESLSMVAGRVAAHVGVGVGGSSGPTPARVTPPPLPHRNSDMYGRLDHAAGRAGEFLDRATDRLSDLSDRMIDAGARLIPGAAERLQPAGDVAAADTIPARQRKLLGVATAAIAGIGAGLFTDRVPGCDNGQSLMFGVTMTLGAMGGIVVAHRRIAPALAGESPWLHRLAFGGIGGVFTFLVSLPVFLSAYGKGQEMMASTWAAVIVPMFLLNVSQYASPSRRERFAIGPAIMAAIAGLISAAIFEGFPTLAIGALAGSCLAVQAAMPWTPGAQPQQPAARKPRKYRATVSPNAETIAMPASFHGGSAAAPSTAPYLSQYTLSLPPVPPAARWGWLLSVPLLLSLGIMLLAGVGTGAFRSDDEQALAVGFGLGSLLLAVFALVRSFQVHYTGWWPYIVRPVALFACVQSALISALCMGFMNLRDEEMLAALFFLIFPIVMIPVLLILRTRPPVARSAGSSPLPPPLPVAPAVPAPAGEPMPLSGEAPTAGPALPQPSRVYAPPAAPLFDAAGVFSWMLTGGAWILLLPALGLALLAAIDLPGFIGAGLGDPRMADDLTREFGFARWPSFLRSWMYIVAHVAMFFSAALLIFARRGNGAAHMLRVVVAIAVFAISVAMMDKSLHGQWLALTDIGGRVSVPASIEQYMEQSSRTGAVLSLLMFAVGLVVLAWPGKARRAAAVPTHSEEVAS